MMAHILEIFMLGHLYKNSYDIAEDLLHHVFSYTSIHSSGYNDWREEYSALLQPTKNQAVQIRRKPNNQKQKPLQDVICKLWQIKSAIS